MIPTSEDNHFEMPDLRHLHLSDQQIDVLKLMCCDKTDAEIAKILDVSIMTVETMKSLILIKAGVHNIECVLLWALMKGLI